MSPEENLPQPERQHKEDFQHKSVGALQRDINFAAVTATREPSGKSGHNNARDPANKGSGVAPMDWVASGNERQGSFGKAARLDTMAGQAETYRSDFIIDLGMCDGGDTAYYLHKGYSVLAIDADPELCAAAMVKFQIEVAADRLKVLNTGVASEDSTLVFHRCLSNPAHSTFDPQLRVPGQDYVEMPVPCRTVRSIVEEYGVPYYLKIDIEGYDSIALDSLTEDSAPPYISVEISHSQDILKKLHNLGYKRFKLINQTYHTTSIPISDDEPWWRVLRKLGRKLPLLRKLILQTPHSLRPRTEWDQKHCPDGWVSPGKTSSGPFGEETHGAWSDFAKTERIFLRVSENHSYIWWDVHARKW